MGAPKGAQRERGDPKAAPLRPPIPSQLMVWPHRAQYVASDAFSIPQFEQNLAVPIPGGGGASPLLGCWEAVVSPAGG